MAKTGKDHEQPNSAQALGKGAASVRKGRFYFPKQQRLRSQRDFQLAFAEGKRRHTEHFTVILRPNALQFPRLGVTVSKKVGNAVKRNRVKRCLREFFRLHKHELPESYDLVIIAKKGAATLAYHEVREELAAVLITSSSL